MEQLQKYKDQITTLQQENEYLRLSKLALISSTSAEIERLRKFISLLANALRGKSYTKEIHEIPGKSTNEMQGSEMAKSMERKRNEEKEKEIKSMKV